MSLLIATPAASGEPAQNANCIVERLSAAESEKLAAEGAVLMETGGFSPAAGALLTPAPECMALHHWTAAQTQLAGRYTIAKLGLPSAEAALRRKGIDPAGLKAIYESLPAQTRARPLGRPDAASLTAKAQSKGLVRSSGDAPLIGRYIGLLNLIDAIPSMLA
jgi:hypothetical protein